jgi:hypothetical protein
VRVLAVRVLAVLAVATAANGIAAVPPAAGDGGEGTGSVPVATAPLSTTWSTPQGSWAIVPMGHLAQPHNTFWELFFRPDTGSGWTLVTPPGVADNGGLVATGSAWTPDTGTTAAGTALPVTAGFEPSQFLIFSPLASTVDGGRSWSPRVMPSGLVDAPDVLAAGTGGVTLALSRTGGGSIIEQSGSTGRWRTVSTRRSLAVSAGARACGLVAAGAVTLAGGVPVAGGTCSRPGMVGIFRLSTGSWRPTGPGRLPGPAGSEPVSVLRLGSGGGGTAGLVQAGRGRAATVFALWQPASSGPWSVSPSLALDGSIVSSGFGPAGGFVVVVRPPGGGRRIESIAGPGAGWSTLPDPPSGTSAVVGSGGTFDALTVASRRFADWRLDPTSGTWRRIQSIDVPISFGSST